MKKSKVTRSLMAACSIVALTAVMYGCVHDGDSETPTVEMPTAYEAAKTAIAAATTVEAAQAAFDAVDLTAVTGQEAQSLRTALADRLAILAPPEPTAVDIPDEIPAGYELVAGTSVIPAGSFGGSGGVRFACEAGGADCTVTVHADGTVTAAPGSGMVTAGLSTEAQAVIDTANALAERQEAQKMALMTAAGMIDTSDLSTQALVDAARAAIADLRGRWTTRTT